MSKLPDFENKKMIDTEVLTKFEPEIKMVSELSLITEEKDINKAKLTIKPKKVTEKEIKDILFLHNEFEQKRVLNAHSDDKSSYSPKAEANIPVRAKAVKAANPVRAGKVSMIEEEFKELSNPATTI